MEKTFHYKVFFPQFLYGLLPSCVVKPKYTQHAATAALNDRYGRIFLPLTIDCSMVQWVECTIDSNQRFVKAVGRIKYNESFDLVFVLTNEHNIKTVWLNDRTDKHQTLKRGVYAKRV